MEEDLAKFNYKLNMKVKKIKPPPIFFGYIFEPCIEIWQFLF
jgi:hypothetical protein